MAVVERFRLREGKSKAHNTKVSKGKGKGNGLARKCTALVKEQRARIYILHQCATMLLCWKGIRVYVTKVICDDLKFPPFLHELKSQSLNLCVCPQRLLPAPLRRRITCLVATAPPPTAKVASDTKIKTLKARQIIDSRGNPTVEVDLVMGGSTVYRSAVPSGASTEIYEALELRDGDKRVYGGKGVLNAVRIINEVLGGSSTSSITRTLTLT
ncbi:hypothetical protein MLD38_030794 [Melastoma candidum]|uniref:Uncharacterized protein n=1 Tax=Melastoma candidum TaxID=119954 RepID=A0ACB9MPV0_9MYRT|nr:hypothetical protein MLD38_030794 [Melastoma candidum]